MAADKINYYLFTDGSARKNGHAGAQARYAYCVFMNNCEVPIKKKGGTVLGAWLSGPHINKAYTKGMPPAPSNNRGELMGILRGLDYLAAECEPGNILVLSDSEYCLNSVFIWGKKWRKDNDVEKKNLDLIYYIIDKINEMAQNEWEFAYKHVKAHRKEPAKIGGANMRGDNMDWFEWHGNDIVDRLAQDWTLTNARTNRFLRGK